MRRSLTLCKASRVTTTLTHQHQCKAVGHTAYDYEIQIQVAVKLDENDFIIDHSVIHEVIQSTILQKMGSCERLCLNIEERVLEVCEEHGCKVEKLFLNLKPADSNAFIKISSEQDDEIENLLDKLRF